MLTEIAEALQKEIGDENIKRIIQEIEDWQTALHSYLEVSRYFGKDLFNKWGLINWRSVNPKRMRDKIYLVLLKDRQPLHYRRIAERINEEDFDKRTAYPATIHNELILDKRFVLIGRGIYALAEWGYKPGAIVDVVIDVLKQADAPLPRERIIEEVMKKRMVKPGSINLTLTNKDLFVKINDRDYILKSKCSV